MLPAYACIFALKHDTLTGLQRYQKTALALCGRSNGNPTDPLRTARATHKTACGIHRTACAIHKRTCGTRAALSMLHKRRLLEAGLQPGHPLQRTPATSLRTPTVLLTLTSPLPPEGCLAAESGGPTPGACPTKASIPICLASPACHPPSR